MALDRRSGKLARL